MTAKFGVTHRNQEVSVQFVALLVQKLLDRQEERLHSEGDKNKSSQP